jgi:hypothetical protein
MSLLMVFDFAVARVGLLVIRDNDLDMAGRIGAVLPLAAPLTFGVFSAYDLTTSASLTRTCAVGVANVQTPDGVTLRVCLFTRVCHIYVPLATEGC